MFCDIVGWTVDTGGLTGSQVATDKWCVLDYILMVLWIMCLLLDRDVGSPFVTGALVGAEIAVGGSKCCY